MKKSLLQVALFGAAASHKNEERKLTMTDHLNHTQPSAESSAPDLLPCPFCGGANIDRAEWSGNDGASGPGCGDCGALADSAEAWNRRATAPHAELAQADCERCMGHGNYGMAWHRECEVCKGSGKVTTHPAEPVGGALVAKTEPIHQARAKPVPGYPVSTAWDDISAEGLAHARAHPFSYEVRTVYAAPTGALVAVRDEQLTDLEARQQVAEALGLGRSLRASFAWSYLLGSIKEAVKVCDDLSESAAAPEGKKE